MKLLALTPAEIAFLTAPPSAAGELAARLTPRLCATLRARLRLPLEARVHAPEAGAEAPARPQWQPDAAFAGLWLARRLGGRPAAAPAAFVSPGLLRTLDAVLAECWLDAPAAAPPPALIWHFASACGEAACGVRLPRQAAAMTRWAREIIRHG
jgi:hypothetical protein